VALLEGAGSGPGEVTTADDVDAATVGRLRLAYGIDDAALQQRGVLPLADARVRDATYLCMPFVRAVNGLSGSALGQ
jgi:hypothetical protein